MLWIGIAVGVACLAMRVAATDKETKELFELLACATFVVAAVLGLLPLFLAQ